MRADQNSLHACQRFTDLNFPGSDSDAAAIVCVELLLCTAVESSSSAEVWVVVRPVWVAVS